MMTGNFILTVYGKAFNETPTLETNKVGFQYFCLPFISGGKIHYRNTGRIKENNTNYLYGKNRVG